MLRNTQPHNDWMTKSTNLNRKGKGLSQLDTQLLPPSINYNNNMHRNHHVHGKHKITVN